MKQTCTFLLLLSNLCLAHSQKHDHHWMLGQPTYEPIPIFGGTDLIFGKDSVTANMVTRDIWFEFTNASICDRVGNLMFATNGRLIIGNDQQLMENGDSINAGEVYDDFVNYGYPCAQSAIILPSSTRDSMFFLFHMRATTSGMGICDRLQKTMVDMRLNGGKGKVVYKNDTIKEHNFAYGKITATKHGNGRDWWVMQPEKATNGYFMVLFAKDSVQEIKNQNIGPIITLSDSRGQSVFSPDGTKYARYDYNNDLNIFGFDRCSGELSDPVHVAITDASDTTFAYGGLAFSPNSRFLYVSAWDRAYQFDTEAADIAASKVVVATYDGFELPYPTTFYLMQLGPNGKIYLSSNNQVNMLHVINAPDKPGLACDFQQHGLITPTYIVFGLPHFPNYRLGKWEGSPCDSLISETKENIETKDLIMAYPNPAQDALTIMLPSDFAEGTDIYLFNQFGQAVLAAQMETGSKMLEVSVKELPNGVYFLKATGTDGKTVSGKVAIQH